MQNSVEMGRLVYLECNSHYELVTRDGIVVQETVSSKNYCVQLWYTKNITTVTNKKQEEKNKKDIIKAKKLHFKKKISDQEYFDRLEKNNYSALSIPTICKIVYDNIDETASKLESLKVFI